MKKLITTLVLFAFVVTSPSALADTGTNGHARPVDEVVADILAAYGVAESDQIDCSQVSEDQFDELGDAVMEMMIGDSRRHRAMDDMMGGEGSESLRAMHISMGQRYLGCASDIPGSSSMGPMGMLGGMMSMMGGFMNMMGAPVGMGMGGFRGGDGTMMSNVFGPWGMTSLGGVGMLLFWVVVIVGIGLFVAWLARQQNIGTKDKSALDILKERYVKGEIDKQEFEDKKKDLIS